MLNNYTHPRQKIIITLSFLLVIVIGLSITIIYPSIKRMKELSQDIYIKRVEAEKIFNRGQNLKYTLEQYNKIKPTVSKLNNLFVIKGKELEFFTALETLNTNTLMEPDVKLSSLESSTQNRQLPLQIRLQESYPGLLKYLSGLENLDYYINISSLRLTATTKDQTNSSVTTLLLAEAYYQP